VVHRDGVLFRKLKTLRISLDAGGEHRADERESVRQADGLKDAGFGANSLGAFRERNPDIPDGKGRLARAGFDEAIVGRDSHAERSLAEAYISR